MSDYIQCRKEFICQGSAFIAESILNKTTITDELNVKDQNITEYVLHKIQTSDIDSYLIYDNIIDIEEENDKRYLLINKSDISGLVVGMTNILLYSGDSIMFSYITDIVENATEYKIYIKDYGVSVNITKIIFWDVLNIYKETALYEIDINSTIPTNSHIPVFLPPCVTYRSNRLDVQLCSKTANTKVSLISLDTGKSIITIPLETDALNVISLISNSKCDWLI